VTNNSVVQIKIQLDTLQAKQSVTEVHTVLEGLVGLVKQLGSEIKTVFASNANNLSEIQNGFQGITGRLPLRLPAAERLSPPTATSRM